MAVALKYGHLGLCGRRGEKVLDTKRGKKKSKEGNGTKHKRGAVVGLNSWQARNAAKEGRKSRSNIARSQEPNMFLLHFVLRSFLHPSYGLCYVHQLTNCQLPSALHFFTVYKGSFLHPFAHLYCTCHFSTHHLFIWLSPCSLDAQASVARRPSDSSSDDTRARWRPFLIR